MPKIPKRNNPAPQRTQDPVLSRMRRRIVIQAGMAVSAIALTAVMIFAMTAAWYTNIVHTSGLTFEVEAWGFNGDITSQMESIVAGPGDEGIIDLQVASSGDSASAVSVSFSKEEMPDPMQQRIYFYADTQVVRNGEIVERVYLNNYESYTYNLFSRGRLTLTETVHNDAQLKWQWVYDVLGYYVQADIVEVAGGQKALINMEYLRPIEYDYDEATVIRTTNSSGDPVMTLQTVDGIRTPEQFLVDLSGADGYEGVIDPAKKLVDDRGNTYYEVRVDEETGSGIYAYLCSPAEIQTNNYQDTALGQGDYSIAEPPYTAKLMVSAQKSKNSVISVNSLAGLMAAAELGAADTIQLSSDVTIGKDEAWTIREGQRIMLDLNGNRLVTTDPAGIPIVVEEGGSLTMANGALTYGGESASKNYAIHITGAEVVMSGVQLSGYEQGMKITDNAAPKSKDSTVRLVGCEWSTNSTTLLVHGNGTDTVQKTMVILEKCKLSSNKIALSGNGNTQTATDGGSFGTDIQIIDSEIISADRVNGIDNLYSAIYHPQKDSVLTIYNSTISGYTGIAVKGGTVNIVGSTVKGLGEGMETIEKFSNSGFNDTGDAVYIETNYGYPIELNITDVTLTVEGKPVAKDSLLTAAHRYALRVHDPKAGNVQVNIECGKFTTEETSHRAVPDQDWFVRYLADGSEIIWDAADHGCTVARKAAQNQNGG